MIKINQNSSKFWIMIKIYLNFSFWSSKCVLILGFKVKTLQFSSKNITGLLMRCFFSTDWFVRWLILYDRLRVWPASMNLPSDQHAMKDESSGIVNYNTMNRPQPSKIPLVVHTGNSVQLLMFHLIFILYFWGFFFLLFLRLIC